MKIWILKAIVQKAISFLPFSSKVNFLFQKYITRGVHLTDHYFEDKLRHAREHIDGYYKITDISLKSSLELGTGWYPVVPVALFLSGADQIHTVDISRLLTKRNVIATIQKFLDYHSKGRLRDILEVNPLRLAMLMDIEKYAQEQSLNQLLHSLNIYYLIQDARKLDLEPNSIDLIHSNNTLEHIYPNILENILKEFKRVSNRRGVMSHFIDMSDHFAHYDRSISIYNFLKFSEQQWRLIDNSVQPQNRWRITHYKSLYENLGIEITHEEKREGNPELLNHIGVAPSFAQLDRNELAVTHCHLISKMN